MGDVRVILGSSSVNRRAVFRELFSDFYVSDDYNFAVPDIDEKAIRDPDPAQLVLKIASAKADKNLEKFRENEEQEIFLLSMDQVVLCRGEIREKPETEAQARTFLASYLKENLAAECVNGIVLHHLPSGQRIRRIQRTTVKFLNGLGDEDAVIERMIRSGIVYGMSGGFTVDPLQDRVEYIDGGVDGIKGFPSLCIRDMMAEIRPEIRHNHPHPLFARVTHVLFDMDGLLLDTEGMYTRAQQKILDPFGKTFNFEVKNLMMGKKTLDGARIFIDYFDLKHHYTEPEQFVKEREEIMSTMLPEAELLPGVRLLLEHLHKHKVPMAIATGSHQRHYNLKTTKHKELFNKVFSHVITGDKVERSKPHPESFIKAAEAFKDYDPQKSKPLVFEDSPLGVEAGLAAGFPCIMVETDYNKDSSVKPTQKIKSLLHFRPEFYGLPPIFNSDNLGEKN